MFVCSRLFYRFDNRLYRANGVLGLGLGMVQQSIDVESESGVGETSFDGTLRENLGRRTAGNDTVSISVWRGGGVSSTECRSRLLFCISTTFLAFSLVLLLYISCCIIPGLKLNRSTNHCRRRLGLPVVSIRTVFMDWSGNEFLVC